LKTSSSVASVSKPVRVKVEVMGHLRDLIAREECEVELNVPTVAALIDNLTSTYGKQFGIEVVDSHSGGFMVLILVNGRDIDSLEKSMTPLCEGDKVTIVPLVAGG
jgi:MoaD family protein